MPWLALIALTVAGPLRIRTGFLPRPTPSSWHTPLRRPTAPPPEAPGSVCTVTNLIVDRNGALLGRTPGLPDDVFESDGLVTKRVIRAAALAHLRPRPGELLWDIGVGAGSVAIEWCRGAEGARAIGVERRADRASRAIANAERLTPPGAFELVAGDAADVVAALPAPDAVFVGGGGTLAVLETAMDALRPGGRIVVHGVTLEAELLAAEAYRRWGGQLTRMQVETAEPLGRLTGWKPARSVVQWSYSAD